MITKERSCSVCGDERQAKKDLCDKCYAKEWRKNNPEKIKSYLERSKKHRNEVREEYYSNNRIELQKRKKKRRQENGYKEDKVEKRKADALIRSQTRNKYPIKGKKCSKCSKNAEHRHHTTEPKEVDKFVFLCEDCHDKIHGRKNYRKDAVFQEIEE